MPAFQIYFWSSFFITGYGQLQNTVETFLGISLIISFFLITVVFFISMCYQKYQKLMFILALVCGIFIVVLIAMNFVWPMLFGLPAF
ncbi:MAG: hypothetical protein ACTSR3_10160 [Candidatus Helarchaeota archaeon]